MKKLFWGIVFCLANLGVFAQSNGVYQIKFLEVNRDNSDYAVAMLEDNKIVFTSAGTDSGSARKNFNPKKNLFVGEVDFDGEILNVQPVDKDIAKKYNTTGVAFTKDQKTVYFSRNNYTRSVSKQKKAKYRRMQIYRAEVGENGKWKNIEKLPFNLKDQSSGFPALNAANDKLFFVSDRQPSMGDTDIFVVDINPNGTFSEPRNLGKTINTSGSETTPYINAKNILYFASDGHEGKGGLDIFATEVFDNYVSDVYHLEAPINSIEDDFAYLINDETNTGFFSSNRLQGNENIDLYSFSLEKDKKVEDCFITVEGLVKDKMNQELLKDATIELLGLDNTLIQSISTKEDGFYSFKVPCSQEYNLVGNASNYKEASQRIEILENNYHKTLHSNLNLIPLKKNEIDDAKNLSKILNLSPIYFDFDKVVIRSDAKVELDKIVEIMKENPSIIVEAQAHTDSWGPASYNKGLSQRRAESTVNYIISKGIDPSRITGKGYGEERLLNDCEDPTQCPKSANQLNRRTEFVIVNSGASIKLNIKKDTKTELAESKPKVESLKASNQTVVKINHKSKVALTEVPKEVIKKEVELAKNEVAPTVGETLEQEAVVSSKSIAENTEIKEAKPEAKPQPQKVFTMTAAIATPVKSDNKAVNHIQDQRVKVLEKLAGLEDKYETSAKENQNHKASYDQEIEKIKNLRAEVTQNEDPGYSKIIFYNNEIISFNKTFQRLTNVQQKVSEENENIIVLSESSTKKPGERNNVTEYMEEQKAITIQKIDEIEKKFVHAKNMKPDFAEELLTEIEKVGVFRQEVQDNDQPTWDNIVEYKKTINSFNKSYKDILDEANGVRRRVSVRKTSFKNEDEATSQTSKNQVETLDETIKVEDVQVVAMKKGSGGNYAETNDPKKADLIKVTFKLLQDEKTSPGQKEAHLVLKSPKGSVANAKGVFISKENNEPSKFTDKTIISDDKRDVNVTMFVNKKGENFEKGIYPIQLYVNRQLVAASNLNLLASN